jgi:hypothetical protein
MPASTSARLIAGASAASAAMSSAVDGRDRADSGQSADEVERLRERVGAHAQAGTAAQLVDRALGDE